MTHAADLTDIVVTPPAFPPFQAAPPPPIYVDAITPAGTEYLSPHGTNDLYQIRCTTCACSALVEDARRRWLPRSVSVRTATPCPAHSVVDVVAAALSAFRAR